MDKQKNILEKINTIQSYQANDFEYDKEAILKDYHNNEENESSIAIKILSVLGGFMANLAFLLFLFISGIYDSEIALAATGVMFIVAAIILNKTYGKLIIDTLSISAYAIGLSLLGIGLAELDVDENLIVLIFIVIAIVTLFITQTYMLSFMAVLLINGSLLALISINSAVNLIHFYIIINTILLTFWFLNEGKILKHNKILSRLYDPIRIALIFSLLMGFAFISRIGLFVESPKNLWISSLAILPAILYLISKILKTLSIENQEATATAYLASLLLLLLVIFSPAISGSILILLLSYYVNYKTGAAIGLLSFTYFMGLYYYDLNFTLLTKSGILFFSGIVFLFFYFFTSKYFAAHEKI